MTESKAEPYAHTSGWGTPKFALKMDSTDDLSSWSLVDQKDAKLFGQSLNFCKNGKIEVRSDLDLKMAVTVSQIINIKHINTLLVRRLTERVRL